MAVLTLLSIEETANRDTLANSRQYWQAEGGKFRLSHFTVPALAAANDITGTIDLCRIPQGKVRILPAASLVMCSAFGGGATMDFGVRAYVASDGSTAVAVLGTDLAAVKDMSGALTGSPIGVVVKKDYFSAKGLVIFATVRGLAMPINATMSGYIAFEMQG